MFYTEEAMRAITQATANAQMEAIMEPLDPATSQRQQIIDTVQILPDDTLVELQAFVQQLRDRTTKQPLQLQASDTERFDQLTKQLIEQFVATRPSTTVPLSDYAVSREGIYGDHP